MAGASRAAQLDVRAPRDELWLEQSPPSPSAWPRLESARIPRKRAPPTRAPLCFPPSRPSGERGLRAQSDLCARSPRNQRARQVAARLWRPSRALGSMTRGARTWAAEARARGKGKSGASGRALTSTFPPRPQPVARAERAKTRHAICRSLSLSRSLWFCNLFFSLRNRLLAFLLLSSLCFSAFLSCRRAKVLALRPTWELWKTLRVAAGSPQSCEADIAGRGKWLPSNRWRSPSILMKLKGFAAGRWARWGAGRAHGAWCGRRREAVPITRWASASAQLVGSRCRAAEARQM